MRTPPPGELPGLALLLSIPLTALVVVIVVVVRATTRSRRARA
ncbi:hypothetical protein [uncultured Propionibacterium sp.]|nr:hypothetical protein [uncultured Propionibacterium sp.]